MENLQKSGYLCNPQQAYTLRKVTVTEGRARGAAVIEVCTADGLQVDILPDAGLDIGQVRYKGINMTFISKNGFDNPALVGVYENEFMNYFPGGLLYTGGLRSVGGANRDGGELHPLHGRFHSLLAEQVSTTVENNTITISGVLRETALFGHMLEVKRTISIPIFGTDISVTDTLTNLTHRDEEYCLLYHCNFGYPLLSADAHVELPEQRRTTSRTPFAAGLLGKECTVSAPVPNEEELPCGIDLTVFDHALHSHSVVPEPYCAVVVGVVLMIIVPVLVLRVELRVPLCERSDSPWIYELFPDTSCDLLLELVIGDQVEAVDLVWAELCIL